MLESNKQDKLSMDIIMIIFKETHNQYYDVNVYIPRCKLLYHPSRGVTPLFVNDKALQEKETIF